MQFPSNVFSLLIAYQIRIANDGAILFYSGAPGPGDLVGALSSRGGTDTFGNVYPPGSVWGVNNLTSYVQQGIGESGYEVDFFSNFVDELVGSRIFEATHLAGGTADYGSLDIVSPIDSVQQDSVLINLYSSSADGTTQNAEIVFGWNKMPLTTLALAMAGFYGFTIPAGSVTAVHPGTGKSRTNLAVPETWQTPVLNSGWTTVGTGTPARFRMEPYGDGGGTVRLDGELMTQGAGPWPAGTDLFNVGAGYTPASGHIFVNKSSIAVGTGGATINVLSTGNVVNQQVFTAAGQSLYLDGMTFPVN